MVKKGGGGGIFSKFRGELAKRGVKKFRGVWTLDEAMPSLNRWDKLLN